MQRSAPQRSSAILLLVSTLLLSAPHLAAQQKPQPLPYSSAIQVHGDTLYLPGLSVQLTPQGLPQQLQVIGQPDARGHSPDTTSLLAENIHFHFTRRSDGKDIRFSSPGFKIIQRLSLSEYRLRPLKEWESQSLSDELQMNVYGRVNVLDHFGLSIRITVLQDVELRELTFHIPMAKDASKYMSGLGVSGIRPDSILVWNWSAARNHTANAWIGDRHAGMQFELSSSPGEQGKGGIAVGIKGKSMLVNDYTGTVELQKGDILVYHFEGMITREPPNDVHLSNK